MALAVLHWAYTVWSLVPMGQVLDMEYPRLLVNISLGSLLHQ